MDRREKTLVPLNRPSSSPIKHRPMDYYSKYLWMAVSVCLAISTLVFARMYYTKSAQFDQLKNAAMETMDQLESQDIPGGTLPFVLEGTNTDSESEMEYQCSANITKIEEACWYYANDNNGRYPTSWSSLVPNYLPTEPHCPKNNTRYGARFFWDRPPEISCPNHGSPYQ